MKGTILFLFAVSYIGYIHCQVIKSNVVLLNGEKIEYDQVQISSVIKARNNQEDWKFYDKKELSSAFGKRGKDGTYRAQFIFIKMKKDGITKGTGTYKRGKNTVEVVFSNGKEMILSMGGTSGLGVATGPGATIEGGGTAYYYLENGKFETLVRKFFLEEYIQKWKDKFGAGCDCAMKVIEDYEASQNKKALNTGTFTTALQKCYEDSCFIGLQKY